MVFLMVFNTLDCVKGFFTRHSLNKNKTMTSILVNVKEEKYEFFLELLESLDFAEIVQEEPERTKEDFKNDLIEAVRDAKLHQQGKKKLPNIEDVLNEL